MFELLCFTQLFTDEKNKALSLLHTLLAEQIVRSFYAYARSKFDYRITGIVLDALQSIVVVGEFKIMLDATISGDIQNGEYVAFECDRLDIY